MYSALYNILRYVKRFCLLAKLFFYDFRTYAAGSGVIAFSEDDGSILARLIKNYHKIEKGLTLTPRKEFFGLLVIDQIFNDIDLLAKRVDESEVYRECINAASAIKEYIDVHSKSDSRIKLFVSKLTDVEKRLGQKFSVRATEPYNRDVFSKTEIDIYEKIIRSRKSVRNFTSNLVDSELVSQALDLALNTPSVCNRQAWLVYHLTDRETVRKVLELQNGNRGFEHAVNELLLVTMDLKRFLIAEERNQLYFDAGLFSMNLVNALRSRGVDSCFLNWCVNQKKDESLVSLIGVEKFKVPVVLIAVGQAEAGAFVCASPRKSVSDALRRV